MFEMRVIVGAAKRWDLHHPPKSNETTKKRGPLGNMFVRTQSGSFSIRKRQLFISKEKRSPFVRQMTQIGFRTCERTSVSQMGRSVGCHLMQTTHTGAVASCICHRLMKTLDIIRLNDYPAVHSSHQLQLARRRGSQSGHIHAERRSGSNGCMPWKSDNAGPAPRRSALFCRKLFAVIRTNPCKQTKPLRNFPGFLAWLFERTLSRVYLDVLQKLSREAKGV